MENLICNFDISRYLIFSDNVFGILIYYSHLLPFFAVFFIGYFIFRNDRESLINKILIFILLNFSIWVFLDLILWANEKSEIIMFAWSIMVLFEILIYVASFYFFYVFTQGKDLPFKFKVVISILIFPVVLLLGTKLNIIGYDATNCNREVIEGFISTVYVYVVEILMILGILGTFVKAFFFEKLKFKSQVLTIFLGLILFLVSFSWGNIIGSLTDNWNFGQMGLIGAPIFVAFLAYMIVRFHAFNMKLMSTEVLVTSLWILVLGILFIRRVENVRVVAAVTLLLVTIAGYLLSKSVKKEVEQREELAKLNVDLNNLLKQRESLVHLITHKVKGSFTRSKYIFAGLLDGTFGEMSPEVKKVAKLGLDSDNAGVETVDLVLNAANLQKGTVKFELKEMDFKKLVNEVIEDKKGAIKEKGLELETNIEETEFKVSGDAFWLKEVVNNLIENSLHYTPKGKITVGLAKNTDKLLFSVKDTGVGITDEDKKNLFTEGGRGKDSVKVNVDSTGYGLYSVKLILEGHGGRVWAESPGPGQGSTFFVELDLI